MTRRDGIALLAVLALLAISAPQVVSAPTLRPTLAPTDAAPKAAASVAATVTPAPTTTPTRTPVVYTRLVATGDVMLGRMVRTESEAHGSYKWPFAEVHGLLAGADITLINLENPFADPCPKSTVGLIFCAPLQSVEGLVYARVDVANLANNHILDKDEAGYDSTLDVLEQAGIQPSDADHLAVIDRQGVRFGFIGFNQIMQYPDTPILTTDEILSRIAQADRQVDVLVVSLHWGEEFRTRVGDPQRGLAYAAVEHGADLIVGTHPHVVQPREMYQGVLILYSLGNFVFDDMSAMATRRGEVAVLEFANARLYSYILVPVTIYDYGQPRLEEP